MGASHALHLASPLSLDNKHDAHSQLPSFFAVNLASGLVAAAALLGDVIVGLAGDGAFACACAGAAGCAASAAGAPVFSSAAPFLLTFTKLRAKQDHSQHKHAPHTHTAETHEKTKKHNIRALGQLFLRRFGPSTARLQSSTNNGKSKMRNNLTRGHDNDKKKWRSARNTYHLGLVFLLLCIIYRIPKV